MVTKIYSRKFSDICDLQGEESIDYNLVCSNDSTNAKYGIELVSVLCNDVCKESVLGISSSKERVMDVIKYLYENSVKIDSCRDIISDIFRR